MHVHPAATSDARGIAQIHVESWRAAYRGLMPDAILDKLDVKKRAEFWETHLTNHPRGIFVAELNQTIVGFCDLMPSRDNDSNPITTAEIVAIYVDPKHWRKGVGQALCRFALESARRENFTAVTLWCLASNRVAGNFYKKMGFHLDGATKIEQSFPNHELHEVRFRISL